MREIVYFIRAVGTDLVKVGRSINVEQRLRELQTGSPVQLAIEDRYLPSGNYTAAQLEAECHRRLRVLGRHSHGEWFYLDRDGVLNITAELTESGHVFDHTNEAA